MAVRCEHSGMPVDRCKALDVCDCFDHLEDDDPDVTVMSSDPDWWTSDDCARYLDIGRGTWTAYVHRKQAPQPGRYFGRTPVWRPVAVKEWAATRPRKGNA